MVGAPYRGVAGNRVGRLIQNVQRADIVIVDDPGVAPLDDVSAQLPFRFVATAYERRSLGIASHGPFEAWDRFLPEPTTAVALLDRLLHQAVAIVTSGDSYWMKETKTRGGGPARASLLDMREKFRATSGGGRRWDAWLESIRPSSSARPYWYNWAPGGDVTSNCQNVSLGFPVLGVIATMTATRCERWDMTLWEDPGHFRNKWNCDCSFGIDADREVAFQIAVKMNQGSTPRWTLSAGSTGL